MRRAFLMAVCFMAPVVIVGYWYVLRQIGMYLWELNSWDASFGAFLFVSFQFLIVMALGFAGLFDFEEARKK